MIVDSHCHAWEQWPYDPAVPDPRHRGSADHLLYEMDRNGVDRAVVVAAQITGNPANNDYVRAAAAAHPDRLDYVFDADSCWSAAHHTPGAAGRLRALADRHPDAVGLTHYADTGHGGWFATGEAREFFATAAGLGLTASVHAPPDCLPDLRTLAAELPGLRLVLHHLGGLVLDRPDTVEQVLACAAVPAIRLKWSGFHYAAAPAWDFPYPKARTTAARLLDAFGADRLLWGSDFPATIGTLTYRQALETARAHAPTDDPAVRARLLGLTARQTFPRRGR